MNFKQWLENADDLRKQLNTQAEEIDYLVDLYLRWYRCMKNRKYWAGRNDEQSRAAREEETKLANTYSKYPYELRMFAQELARKKLGLPPRKD